MLFVANMSRSSSGDHLITPVLGTRWTVSRPRMVMPQGKCLKIYLLQVDTKYLLFYGMGTLTQVYQSVLILLKKQ